MLVSRSQATHRFRHRVTNHRRCVSTGAIVINALNTRVEPLRELRRLFILIVRYAPDQPLPIRAARLTDAERALCLVVARLSGFFPFLCIRFASHKKKANEQNTGRHQWHDGIVIKAAATAA